MSTCRPYQRNKVIPQVSTITNTHVLFKRSYIDDDRALNFRTGFISKLNRIYCDVVSRPLQCNVLGGNSTITLLLTLNCYIYSFGISTSKYMYMYSPI